MLDSKRRPIRRPTIRQALVKLFFNYMKLLIVGLIFYVMTGLGLFIWILLDF